MPAFQKWSSPEWQTAIKSESKRVDSKDGNDPAPQRPAPAEDPLVANPISLPAEVRAPAEVALIMESKRQQIIVFKQKVDALGDREFKGAIEILRMYMGGKKSIEEVYQLAAMGLKDRDDLLAEFRAFLPAPTSSPVFDTTPQMSVPKCKQETRCAEPAFPEQSLERKRTGVAGDILGGKLSSNRQMAAVEEQNNAQEPERRSTRVPQPRAPKDIGLDQEKKRSYGGNGVALKIRRQAQAELAEQTRNEEQQKRRAEEAEQKRLALFKAWWPVHLKPDYKLDEIEIGKPSRNGKFWYPWISHEPEVEPPDPTENAGPEVQLAESLASEKVMLLYSIYLKFMRHRPIVTRYRCLVQVNRNAAKRSRSAYTV